MIVRIDLIDSERSREVKNFYLAQGKTRDCEKTIPPAGSRGK